MCVEIKCALIRHLFNACLHSKDGNEVSAQVIQFCVCESLRRRSRATKGELYAYYHRHFIQGPTTACL